MSPLEFAILGFYFLTLVVLAVFGFHRYIMVFLYRAPNRPNIPEAESNKIQEGHMANINAMAATGKLIAAGQDAREPWPAAPGGDR